MFKSKKILSLILAAAMLFSTVLISSADEGTEDTSTTIIFEAENYTTLGDTAQVVSAASPFEEKYNSSTSKHNYDYTGLAAKDTIVSGGAYVMLNTDKATLSDPATVKPVSYTINIPETGKYYVWVRVGCLYSDNNRLWAGTDGKYNSEYVGISQSYSKIDTNDDGVADNDDYRNQTDTEFKFVWKQVKTPSRDSYTHSFTAGEHTIDLTYNRFRPLVDQILITDDSSYTPEGILAANYDPSGSGDSGTPTPTQTVEPTEAPTATPTVAPTEAPTATPTVAPTEAPTATPTVAPTEAPTPTPTVAPTEAPIYEFTDGSTMFEAEEGSLSESTTSMVVDSSFKEPQYSSTSSYLYDYAGLAASTSGEAYLMLCTDKYVANKSDWIDADEAAAMEEAEVSYKINVPEAGTYYVWVRVGSPNDKGTGMWLGTDVSGYQSISGYTFADNSNPEFYWKKVTVTFEEAGVHTIDLIHNRPRTLVDKIIVTNKVSFVPSGLGSIGKVEYEAVYDMPEVTPVEGQHPRVYFTAEDIPTIKANLTKPQNMNAYEMLMDLVEDHTTTGILSSTGAYEDAPLKAAEAKALYYALFSEEAQEIGEEAIEIMYNFITTASADSFDYNRAGQTIYTMAVVYDWCYPLMTDNMKEVFHDMMLVFANQLEMEYPFAADFTLSDVSNIFVGHGAEAIFMRDMLSAAVAMYDEYPVDYQNIAGLILNEMVEPREFMYSMHMYQMGSGYADYRAKWEIICTLIFDALGVESVFGTEQEDTFVNYLYTRRGDGQVLLDGDNSQQNKAVGEYNDDMLKTMFLVGNYYGNPYLKYEAMRCMDNMTPEPENYNNGLSAVEFLIFNDPDLEGKSFEELPLTYEQPSPKGGMIARTSWEDGYDSPAVVVEMKINEYQLQNHQHLDAGSFQIYYKGALATDDGYYKGYTGGSTKENTGNTNWKSMHWYNYYRRTIAHNSMLVYDPDEIWGTGLNYISNDGGQRLTPATGPTSMDGIESLSEFKIGEVLGQEYGLDQREPNYTYLKGDITEAYTDKVQNFERSFMFLNLKDEEHPAVLLVFDRVVSSDASFKKTWLCHSLYEPTISGNRTVFKNTENAVGADNYNGMLTIDTLLPASVNITSIGGEGYEHYVDGTNYIGLPATSFNMNEGQGWRVEVSPSEENTTDYFLNVLQIGDADGAEPYQVSLIETETNAGAVVADRVVLFGKDRDRTQTDVTFSFTGELEAYEITVADLVAGTWQVTKDGIALCTAIATEDGGVAVFNGGSGTYTLSYLNENAVRETYSSEAPETEGISVRVDGRFIYFETEPTMQNDCVLAPMETLAEKIEANYVWNADTKTATATRGSYSVVVTAGSQTAYVDGEPVTMETAAIMKDGVLMVPAIFFAEGLSSDTSWDPFSKTVNISPLLAEGYENCATVVNVTAPCNADFVAANLIDHNIETIWSNKGNTDVIFEFDQPYDLVAMEMMFNPSSERTAFFEVAYSVDGENYTTIISDGVSDGKAYMEWEHFSFGEEPVTAKYIRYTAKGSNVSQWNGVIEARFKVYEAPVLEIVESATDGSYTLGSNAEVIITTTGEFAKFESVEMDGEIIDKSNYSVKEGSTIVTFKAAYLETLSEGEHIVTINYTDGSNVDSKLTMIKIADKDTDSSEESDNADENDDVDDSSSGDVGSSDEAKTDVTVNGPKTGDDSGILMYITFVAGGIILFLLYLIDRRRKMIKVNND